MLLNSKADKYIMKYKILFQIWISIFYKNSEWSQTVFWWQSNVLMQVKNTIKHIQGQNFR